MFNTTHANLSKETIASRMFRNAARLWGLNDTNMDNFDPLVRLLVEACAVEIYRIDNEIASLQRVMTERLAGLLIPEVHIHPRPAHAVVHATSTDDASYISLESQFLFQKRVASVPNGPLDKNMDILFSPVGRQKTIAADVQMIATGTNVYKLSALQQKETFLRTQPGQPIPPQTIWIGINAAAQQDLTDVSFFFDLKNTPGKAQYLSMLGHAKCYCNGREVQLTKGLSTRNSEDGGLKFEDALEELYINRRLEKMVTRIYSNHFLTISPDEEALSNIGISDLQNYPREFEDYLGTAGLSQLSKKMLWFRFVLPPEFTTLVLEDLTISTNCFPIANRQLNRINYRLNSYFNIIPLLTEQQFFAVRSVEGTKVGPEGRGDYVYYPFDQYDKQERGQFSVRTGDIERFDSRNAAEYLNYLVELLRDESSAFAAFGQDFMSSTIKDLNQNIGLIEQKIKQNTSLLHSSPSYLLINPLEENDTIFVQFWTCSGEQGNNIRSGSKMILFEGQSFRGDTIALMTQTTGGMDKLKNTEILTSFKSVLLSRNRIVTATDIRNFCFAYLQNKVVDVKVSKGVGVSPQPNQGLMPVVNVQLIPNSQIEISDLEWESTKAELMAELQNGSAIQSNYSISIG